MNTNTLYDIYKLNHETEGEDLTVSMAKFQATNSGALPHEEAKAMREFIGKHSKALSAAYRKGKAAFEAVAEVLYAEDKEAQEAAQ